MHLQILINISLGICKYVNSVATYNLISLKDLRDYSACMTSVDKVVSVCCVNLKDSVCRKAFYFYCVGCAVTGCLSSLLRIHKGLTPYLDYTNHN